jgi:diguanylate cyclase (GGDEF)-like protein
MPISVLRSTIGNVGLLAWRRVEPLAFRRFLAVRISIGIAASGVVLAGISALALRGDLLVADGISYLAYTFSLLVCAAACVPYARRERDALRARWLLFAAVCFIDALSFLKSALTQLGWWHWGQREVWLAGSAAVSGSLVLLAATMFFSRASRGMVALDAMQALLFGSLRFALVTPYTGSRVFYQHHLMISTAVLGFYFATAMTALLGAGSRGERQFLRLFTIFLGLQFVACVLANQVSYVWLHYEYASVWDIPETIFNMAFAVMAVLAFSRANLRTGLSTPALAEGARPTLFVRNLMPSFLALGNVALGLLVMLEYPLVGVVAVLIAPLGYVFRAALLQSQDAREREVLGEANRELEQLTTHDALTGAGNRRSVVAALARCVESKKLETVSLLLVDADWFKQANDNHGHQYGDEVLVRIALVLRSASQAIPDGHCARLGGDEFVVLLPNLDAAATQEIAEEIRLGVSDLKLQAGEQTISISLGATVARLTAGLTFESLMNRADEALYRAKSMGRNRVEMWG